MKGHRLDQTVVNRQVVTSKGKKILIIGAPEDKAKINKLARQLGRRPR